MNIFLLAGNARPIAVGMSIGIALAFGAGAALSQTLRVLQAPFKMNAFDPLAYVLAALLFSVVTLAAMVGPARRAVRMDPVRALREE
jgi:ABC-type antimicrobial peptide transport system permease subunit